MLFIVISIWNEKDFKTPAYVGLLFVLYTVSEDLPMYLELDKAKTHLPGYNLGMYEGTIDSILCRTVSQSDHTWRPHMLWMSLNYTVSPWCTIIALRYTHSQDMSKINRKDI